MSLNLFAGKKFVTPTILIAYAAFFVGLFGIGLWARVVSLEIAEIVERDVASSNILIHRIIAE